MSSAASGRKLAIRLLIVVAAICAVGLAAIALSASTGTPTHTLKHLFVLALGITCLGIAAFSMRTGTTGAGLVTFVDRAKHPIYFWLIVAFWVVVGLIWVGVSANALHSGTIADTGELAPQVQHTE